MKQFFALCILILLISASGISQILDVTPTFPTIEDEVTIVYDATQGNAALVGTSPVYGHMGVITSESTSGTDWQFVQGEWGTADASVLMTDLGNDRHQIVIDLDQFYGFPNGTEVLQMSFVFRNEDGSLVGRDTDGSDIFYDVTTVGTALQAALLEPSSNIIAEMGEDIDFSGSANVAADLQLFDNGMLIASETNATVLNYTLTVSAGGSHDVVFLATNGGQTSSDTVNYVVNGAVNVANPPVNTVCGANYNSATSVTVSLYAPEKEYVYLIGDFNGWVADPAYFMNRSTDGTTWWLTLSGLEAGQKYAYQYWIDGQGKYADGCSELILDPWNDFNIDSETYPNPHPYPSGLTTGSCSVIQPGASDFNWQNDDYARPEKTKMVIYELLVRDFVAAHNYLTLIDTLDYFVDLGINAIELMPPGEFEGNDSWGYNPSFHMALDKYYGTPEHFKLFIDACHERGIAVIVDMVLNHAFGQHPFSQMYWDAPNNRPAANNPWLNEVCPSEPYCWGSDFDHTKLTTQSYVDRVNKHWLEEYHIDGFRFDYTSGFHNGPAGGYSATRIGLVQRMMDEIWSVDSEAYVILEHWCDNSEETQLSNYGALLWGNVTFNYQEAAMGYLPGSNFEWGLASQRGWADHHLVSFLESHDEERVTYKTLQFGNSAGDYDTQELNTALARNELNAVFFLSQPGPKMIWQFGEMGYDISIDFDCRVCAKPILWNYYNNNNRQRLHDIYAAMNALRNDYPAFTSTNFAHSLGGAFKRINLYDNDMDAVVIGNFDVVAQSGVPNFPYTGTWYDYFSGTEIVEENLNNEFELQPGEFRVYTSEQLEQPEVEVGINEGAVLDIALSIMPNPVGEELNVSFELKETGKTELVIYDVTGKIVKELLKSDLEVGGKQFTFNVASLSTGTYHLLIAIDGVANAFPFVKE